MIFDNENLYFCDLKKIKMKKTVCLILISIVFNSVKLFSQDTLRARIPVDTNTKLITYIGVVNEAGTKDELYKRGIEWINANYKNPAEVTRIRDAVNGEIEGQHRIQMYYIDKDGNTIKTGLVEYTFILQFKDNKYRYKFTNFYLKDKSRYAVENWLDPKNPGYSPLWDDYLRIIDNHIRKLIESLKAAMPAKKIIKDEW